MFIISSYSFIAWLFAVHTMLILGESVTGFTIGGSILLILRPRIKVVYLSLAAFIPGTVLYFSVP